MLEASGEPSPDLHALAAELRNPKGLARHRARQALIEIGQPAVPVLVDALSGSDRNARWEAAKALTEIPNPAAAPVLVGALEDREFGVRWLAAEALSTIGPAVLEPLLAALIERPGSIWLRDGAHHVLKDIANSAGMEDELRPVMAALKDIQPVSVVPQAAKEALAAARARG
jgi:HEAT repeat protein